MNKNLLTHSYITWDPSRGMFNFNLPILNRPILWYGFFFALGFFAGYLLLTYLLRRYFHHLGKDHIKQRTAKLAEHLTLYLVVGALVGARIGDVLFYQNWASIARDPLSIIAFWEGGLASHGAAVGVLISLWLFSKKTKTPFWTAVDFTVIPATAAAIFIRIGNFFNQEILGVPTALPWGVLFLHPADGGPIVPRHPAQLYEAIAYAVVLAALLFYWHRHPPFTQRGRLTGLFFVLVFSVRFLIEFLKMEQSAHFSCSGCLTMGQYLSIPFILLGLWLLMRKI